MKWVRVKYSSQIDAIQEGSLLLKYPLMQKIPEKLNDDSGDIYKVESIQKFAKEKRYNISHYYSVSVQQMIENIYPTPINSNNLQNDGVWFVVE